MNTLSAPTPRLKSIDALRGVAIILVLAYHFKPDVEAVGAVSSIVLTVLKLGWMGVDLFFVLSGFLITGNLLDTENTPGRLRRFYARRALRILPLFYGALGALLLIAVGLRSADMESAASAALLRDQTWYWLHAGNVAVARSPSWDTESWVQHFWSLAVEEQFYVIWPLVIIRLRAESLPKFVLALAAVALLTRSVLAVLAEHATAAYVLTPARADALAIGAVLAWSWRRPWCHDSTDAACRWLLLLMPAVLIALVTWYGPGAHGFLMATVGHTYLALLFGALLWNSARSETRAKAQTTGASAQKRALWPLHFFARYSYGLYVVHVPVLFLLDACDLGAGDLTRAYGFWTGTAAGVALGIGASFLIAIPLWHCFEAPILRAGGARLNAYLARAQLLNQYRQSDQQTGHKTHPGEVHPPQAPSRRRSLPLPPASA